MLEAGGAGSKGLQLSNLIRRGLTGPSGHSAFDRMCRPSARALPSCKSVLLCSTRHRVEPALVLLTNSRFAVALMRGRRLSSVNALLFSF
jgi:hypothetical protein